jgi:hypothetical protein
MLPGKSRWAYGPSKDQQNYKKIFADSETNYFFNYVEKIICELFWFGY